jgi:hypothetical protein
MPEGLPAFSLLLVDRNNWHNQEIATSRTCALTNVGISEKNAIVTVKIYFLISYYMMQIYKTFLAAKSF